LVDSQVERTLLDLGAQELVFSPSVVEAVVETTETIDDVGFEEPVAQRPAEEPQHGSHDEPLFFARIPPHAVYRSIIIENQGVCRLQNAAFQLDLLGNPPRWAGTNGFEG
jgi:hypothetical protein